jgi:hypothetical protein
MGTIERITRENWIEDPAETSEVPEPDDLVRDEEAPGGEEPKPFPQKYVVSEEGFRGGGPVERWFVGYRLGSVRVNDQEITAYFVLEDDDDYLGDGYMLTHCPDPRWDAPVRRDYEEYTFLGYYGVRLAYPLVWAVGAAEVPEIVEWFDGYESWGI